MERIGMGREVEEKPRILITDELAAYHKGYLNEFYTQKQETGTEHVRDIRVNGRMHNNKMEWLNGEINDREKTMRSLKKSDTPILSGYQIFHNYVRSHEALYGRAPAGFKSRARTGASPNPERKLPNEK